MPIDNEGARHNAEAAFKPIAPTKAADAPDRSEVSVEQKMARLRLLRVARDGR
jgi:hypothetical protein